MKLLLLKMLRLFFPKSTPIAKSIERILIVRQDRRIGNMLFITPLIREAHNIFPLAEIDVLVPKNFSEIFHFNPHITNIIEFDHKGLIISPHKFFKMIGDLRRRKYDIVFDTKDVLSFTNALITILSAVNMAVGYDYKGSEIIHNKIIPLPSADMYEPRRHLKLLEALNDEASVSDKMEIFITEAEIEATEFLLAEQGFASGGFIAIHCGGRGRKAYGVKRFFTVARALAANYSLKSLLIYGPDEEEEVGNLAESSDILWIEPGDIREMASYIYHCGIFLSGDTGALHLAVALDKPTVSLFFGSYWARYAPKGDKHTVYYRLDVPPSERKVAEMVAERFNAEGGFPFGN